MVIWFLFCRELPYLRSGKTFWESIPSNWEGKTFSWVAPILQKQQGHTAGSELPARGVSGVPAPPSPAFSFHLSDGSFLCAHLLDEKDCMCCMGCVFSSLPSWKWFFGGPAVSRALWNVVMRLLCSSPWVPSAVPAALPSQEMCPVSHPLPFCKMWHNDGSAEKQGQEKGGFHCSLHVMSFELGAGGFCVVFFFLVLSRFNSSVGSLIIFSLLNKVYNFAFPKITKILILGSFSLKRSFDSLCKIWFSCFASPLCNLPVDSR